MYSAKVVGLPLTYHEYTFYTAEKFKEFVNLFIQEIDLETIILNIAAIHPQFPSKIFHNEAKTSCSTLNKDISVSMYEKFKLQAEQNGIGTIIYNAENNSPFVQDIPLNTKHVYLSTI